MTRTLSQAVAERWSQVVLAHGGGGQLTDELLAQTVLPKLTNPALDALLDYGRPAKVELCVLVDRKEHRQFPIQPDFTGKTVSTHKAAKVKLVNGEVVLL